MRFKKIRLQQPYLIFFVTGLAYYKLLLTTKNVFWFEDVD